MPSMQTLMTVALIVVALGAACLNLQELFICWYSGVSEMTAWQVALMVTQSLLCVGIVVVEVLRVLTSH